MFREHDVPRELRVRLRQYFQRVPQLLRSSLERRLIASMSPQLQVPTCVTYMCTYV